MAPHGRLAISMAFSLTSLSTLVVALRFYSRYYLVRKLGSPDWLILAALLATWSTAIITVYNNDFQDYSHAHDLEDVKRIATGSLLTIWLFRLNYMLSHLLIKTSILIFFDQITSSHKSFHTIVRVMIAIVVLASVSFLLVSIFLCRPVADAWSADVFFNGFRGIIATQCLNPIPLWLTNAGWNLATDALIWILPVPFVLNLRTMPVKRRLELAAIFSIGVIAIIASAVRLWVTVRWLSSWDESGKQWGNLLMWSQVEQHAGIIAASIPFLRPLVRKAVKARKNQQSPGPAAKLIPGTPDNPVMPRTPIIPSPAPTFASDHGFRPTHSPLSPVSPMKPEFLAIHTV